MMYRHPGRDDFDDDKSAFERVTERREEARRALVSGDAADVRWALLSLLEDLALLFREVRNELDWHEREWHARGFARYIEAIHNPTRKSGGSGV